MRFRVTRYLVKELGFRTIALETPWLEARALGAYVQQCRGDLTQPLRSIFWVWASQAMKDTVQWMCRWNRGHPEDRVRFWGFDIQEPAADAAELRKLVARTPMIPESRVDALSICDGVTGKSATITVANRPKDAHQTCLVALRDLSKAVDAAAITGDLGDRIKLSILGLEAWEQTAHYYLAGETARSKQKRDRGMARVFLQLRRMRSSSARVVLWAHNNHIARNFQDVAVATGRWRSMGGFLSDALGARYVAIGLIASRADINWPAYDKKGTDWAGAALGTMDALLRGTRPVLEERLRKLGRGYLLVDLERASTVVPPRGEFEVGTDRMWMRPLDQFQAVIYLEHSPPMISAFRE